MDEANESGDDDNGGAGDGDPGNGEPNLEQLLGDGPLWGLFEPAAMESGVSEEDDDGGSVEDLRKILGRELVGERLSPQRDIDVVHAVGASILAPDDAFLYLSDDGSGPEKASLSSSGEAGEKDTSVTDEAAQDKPVTNYDDETFPARSTKRMSVNPADHRTLVPLLPGPQPLELRVHKYDREWKMKDRPRFPKGYKKRKTTKRSRASGGSAINEVSFIAQPLCIVYC